MHEENRQGEVLFADFADLGKNTEGGKKFYIESYGCAMNFSDSEIVASILGEVGYKATRVLEAADLVLINTCSIREKAEDTVRKRLKVFQSVKKTRPKMLVGVLGCMAERLKAKFLEEEKLVDMVVGPDAYRSLPNLIATAEDGEKGINVFLSREETYADIAPVRLDSNGITAFISIMRGCDNMCSFCVVPYTRGRERSREPFSIIAEARDLYERGYREVTLLGQNVDSFKWKHPETGVVTHFAELLESVAKVSPELRVRFSTSHPKDITDDVLFAINKHENICNYIHLPVQSGNSRVLQLMNRTYDRDWYMEKVRRIYEVLPDCAISSDMITGFCTETEEDHQMTLDIMKEVKYDGAYMYKYSPREKTKAWVMKDDVDEETKSRRLMELVEQQRGFCYEKNIEMVGKTVEIIVESLSRKSDYMFTGRTDGNKSVIIPKNGFKIGDKVMVKVNKANSATLFGEVVY